MGERIDYECNNCGWTYIRENDIFMIDEKHNIKVTPHLMLTSMQMGAHPANGFYYERYCYHCNKFVKIFIIKGIWDNIEGFKKDDIIKDIEKYDNSIKIIEFDESDNTMFSEKIPQKCPACRNKIKELIHKSKCPKCKRGKLISKSIIMMD
ncbi:hypothetical protein [Methanobrevibacter millerae]|uniref:Uncharacterized protein n=1 Tax=Methanobrevibacter millerae TaxID=230361 RepID=A0A1G5WWC4_9EURY|nr:hypothetical protein [Methanobrevibacter millerae]SDA62429.1 hypothetical protein SAMN02910315_01752 [Methanobrevibacter millerae]